MSRATGIPHASVGRLAVWKAFVEWREAAQVGVIRTSELTATMLAVLADQRADEPAEIVAARELTALVAEQAQDAAEDHYPAQKG